MNKPPLLSNNFARLQEHDEQLLRLSMLAERYFPDDPNTSILKLRQLAELLAQLVAVQVGLYQSPEESQYDLLRRLQDQGILPREIAQLFGEVRRAGNAVSHAMTGDHRSALATLKITWQLGLCFHRTFKNPAFKSGPFIPPQWPQDESAELRAELTLLSQAFAQDRAAHQETAQRLDAAEARLREARDEQSFWEQMAREAVTALVAAANTAAAALHLDETETRKLIDQQLRQAGWTADSATLVYVQGARPEKNKNLAIAEWPTHSGPADYVLFVGLTPVAVVEAKRQNLDVSAALQQAKRYSRGFMPSLETPLHTENWGPDGAYRIPFVFSSNGRPFLRQLATRSGIWFCDLRRPENLGHALDGWYTPEGLTALLKRHEDRVHEQLKREPFAYGFALRHYQQAAIRTAEAAIASGQRDMLLAMATGTGKTKTCIALIYRLLKAQRFRRVLFLVDRSALGEHAANAFRDKRMESLQTFADIFGIKELDEQKPDIDTAVHIATVQGMVHRTLYPGEARDFETRAGISPTAFIGQLKSMPLDDVAAWLTQNPDLSEILDRQSGGRAEPVFVSHHDDSLLGTKRGYGRARRPEDYLKEFSDFIRANGNAMPALITVLTRPRELTRKQLRELALELDKAGFNEASLSTAWREMTNQDIAARIVGYIRQAAIGDPLVSYEQRVDNALQKLLASRAWSTPQRQRLQRIAAQTKANVLVDREALDDPDLVFKREGGGFAQLDRIFGGELHQVLDTFNESLWPPAA